LIEYTYILEGYSKNWSPIIKKPLPLLVIFGKGITLLKSWPDIQAHPKRERKHGQSLQFIALQCFPHGTGHGGLI
jgi:hypothetical protein